MNDDLIRRSDVLRLLEDEGRCGYLDAGDILGVPAVDAVELPVKPGADLWWVDEDSEGLDVKCDKGGVKGVAVMADGSFKLVESLHGPSSYFPNSEYGITEINGDTSLLSEELAKEYREKLLRQQEA